MLYDKTDDWEKRQDEKNKEHKMTREEAIKIMDSTSSFSGAAWVTRLEALGLLKFEEKKVQMLFELNNGNITYDCDYNNKHGTIRLEEWPEGLVLWVGSEIVWKSWEKYYKKGDTVAISNVNSDRVIGIIK